MTPNQTHLTKPTKPKLLVKAVNAWVRSAFGNVLFLNQTVIGLENPTHFWGLPFPNQTGFGLEKDTEWNVAAEQTV